MPNQISILSIYIRRDFKAKRPTLRGPAVKFEIRDEPANPHSRVHEKKVTLYDGEYGDNNAHFWCQFEASLREVFARKPCSTGSAKFGATTSCLTGKALSNFRALRESFEGPKIDALFEVVLNEVKRDIFEGETPRANQVDYLENLRKPADATFN